jgi:hypothetical protein
MALRKRGKWRYGDSQTDILGESGTFYQENLSLCKGPRHAASWPPTTAPGASSRKADGTRRNE